MTKTFHIISLENIFVKYTVNLRLCLSSDQDFAYQTKQKTRKYYTVYQKKKHLCLILSSCLHTHIYYCKREDVKFYL